MSARDILRMNYRPADSERIKSVIEKHVGWTIDDEEHLDGLYTIGEIYEVNWFARAADQLIKRLPNVPWIAWAGPASEDGEVVFFYLPDTDPDATYLVELAREEEMAVLAEDVFGGNPVVLAAAEKSYRILEQVREMLKTNN